MCVSVCSQYLSGLRGFEMCVYATFICVYATLTNYVNILIKNEMGDMGFFKSTKGSIISDYFKLTEGVAQLKAGNMYDVALYADYLEVKGIGGAVKLKYDQITDVYYGLETEITQKNKSVIGRAVAGGLIFGGVGAVVGAVSGAGKKDKKERKFMFIISYTSSSGDDTFISFEDTKMYKGVKIARKLKELTHVSDSTQEYL